MKAVSYVINNHDDFKNSLVDIEKAKPTLKERDVLVKVQAISVNPVDTKVRKNSSEANNRILGWDAVGEIIEVGSKVTSFKVEMVIRGYLSGHAAREYAAGKRTLCGVTMAEGLKENDKFPEPIITPTTKADNGEHDADISREAILSNGIVTEEDYLVLEKYTRALFQRGTEIAANRGLILVDTKYEFGKTKEGQIVLIDEIHTPDSSRYFYAEGYQERQDKGEEQKQLSKEFVRRWLIENGFQGKEGQQIPEMTEEYIESVSDRYIELYENRRNHVHGRTYG
jgi:phosphoribosylaminoimidazole-succinocarboxamide synthase